MNYNFEITLQTERCLLKSGLSSTTIHFEYVSITLSQFNHQIICYAVRTFVHLFLLNFFNLYPFSGLTISAVSIQRSNWCFFCNRSEVVYN